MTAKKAVNIGHVLINVPVLAIILGYIYIGTMIMEEMGLPFWWFFPSLAGVLIIAWLYWSIVAPRWLVWAYKNVSNKRELKERAISGKLIWEDDKFWGKTMILTKKDKAIIAEAEHEIETENAEKAPLNKFLRIYIQKWIFWSMFIGQIVLAIVSFYLVVTGLFPLDRKTVVIGVLLGAICIPIWFIKVPILDNKEPFLVIVKRYFAKEIQLEINETGLSIRAMRTGIIEWKSLYRYNIIATFFGRVEMLHLSYWDENEEIKIVEVPFEYFSIDEVTLRELLDYHLEKGREEFE